MDRINRPNVAVDLSRDSNRFENTRPLSDTRGGEYFQGNTSRSAPATGGPTLHKVFTWTPRVWKPQVTLGVQCGRFHSTEGKGVCRCGTLQNTGGVRCSVTGPAKVWVSEGMEHARTPRCSAFKVFRQRCAALDARASLRPSVWALISAQLPLSLSPWFACTQTQPGFASSRGPRPLLTLAARGHRLKHWRERRRA